MADLHRLSFFSLLQTPTSRMYMQREQTARHLGRNRGYDTIRYDTIEEINVDTKAEYTD